MARGLEELFRRYRRTGDPELLGEIFDSSAPSLLRVALHLTADSAQAEDALQSTFLTAIERRKVWDSSRPLLPWLQGILNKHLKKTKLADARRPRADRVRPEATIDAASEAERREAIALVRSHVDRLSEDHRQVLLLHLGHGLEPAEIAEVLNLAPSAVRMRLMRAREELKRLLPDSIAPSLFGLRFDSPDLTGLRARILERAAMPSPVLVATGGALLMKKILTSVAAVGLLAFLATTWIGLDPFGAEAGSPDGLPESEPISLQGDAPEFVPIEGRRHRLIEPATVEEWPELETGSLRVRVINAQGNPAPAVGVAVLPQDGDAQEMGLLYGVTDPQGIVSFESLAAGTAEVHLDRFVSDVAKISVGEISEIEITLRAGVAVFGQVVDWQGRPVPHADLWVRLYTVTLFSMRVGAADENGNFRLEDLAANASAIGASMNGYAPSLTEVVRGGPGDEQDMRIILPGPGARVRGLVLDEEGRPVVGALLHIGGKWGGAESRHTEDGPWRRGWAPRRLRSDERGTFYVDGLATGEIAFLVNAAGRMPYSGFFRLLPKVTNEITIRLERGAGLRGRVLSSEGTPISSAKIEVEGYGPARVQRGRSDRLGRFHFSGLDPRRMKLTVSAVGYVSQVEELSSEAGGSLRVDVQLRRARILRGKILDPDGEPLPGWILHTEFNRDNNIADMQGRFTVPLGDLEKTRLWVAPPETRGAIACDWLGEVLVGEEELVIQVPSGLMPSATIHGRLLDASGIARQGIFPALYQDGYWVAYSLVDPEQGSFTFEPLAPGTYELKCRISSSKAPPFSLVGLTVVAGQDLDLGEIGGSLWVGPGPGWLNLSMRRTDEVPLAKLWVFLYDGEGRELGSIFMDDAAHGRQKLVAGDYELSALVDNAQWLRQEFTIVEGQESKIDLLLRPAARRSLTFPFPVPANWQGVKRVDYVIKGASGEVILEGSMGKGEIPFTVVPAFEIGQQFLELRTDDGRRYVGSFTVENLDKSSVPIVVEVKKDRGR